MPPRADARAIKAQVVGSLATRVNLEVLTAGREVVQQSSRRWRRVTDSAPCGWCAMLAGRGPVYRSAEKAGSGGNRYHGHCGCTAEPFDGDPSEWEPTPDEQRFIDAYEATHEPGMSEAETAARIERWLAENPAAGPAGDWARWREGRDIHVGSPRITREQRDMLRDLRIARQWRADLAARIEAGDEDGLYLAASHAMK